MVMIIKGVFFSNFFKNAHFSAKTHTAVMARTKQKVILGVHHPSSSKQRRGPQATLRPMQPRSTAAAVHPSLPPIRVVPEEEVEDDIESVSSRFSEEDEIEELPWWTQEDEDTTMKIASIQELAVSTPTEATSTGTQMIRDFSDHFREARATQSTTTTTHDAHWDQDGELTALVAVVSLRIAGSVHDITYMDTAMEAVVKNPEQLMLVNIMAFAVMSTVPAKIIDQFAPLVVLAACRVYARIMALDECDGGFATSKGSVMDVLSTLLTDKEHRCCDLFTDPSVIDAVSVALGKTVVMPSRRSQVLFF